MKYIIHNKQLIGDKQRQELFEEEVARKVKLLEKLLFRYSKYPVAEIYVSRIRPEFFRISVSLKLKSKLLYHEAEGDKPILLVNNLLDKLRENVKKQVAIERREHLFKRKARRTKSFGEFAYKLDQLYAEKEREQFNHLMKQLLPSFKQYVLRYLVRHGKERKLDVSVQEILDEIYLALYERFSERPGKTDDLSAWSFKIARETLKEILDRHTESADWVDIHTMAKQEMKSMIEKFTADADGDLIMYEELDDISYLNENYGTEILPDEHFIAYPETEEDTSSTFQEEVSEILQTYDEPDRLVFELYWLDALTEEEISEATGIEVKKVKEIIGSVTEKIMTQFKKQNHELPSS